jgi:hypothetical protein
MERHEDVYKQYARLLYIARENMKAETTSSSWKTMDMSCWKF